MMKIKLVSVRLEGTSPYLMHRFPGEEGDEEVSIAKSKRRKVKNPPRREEAEKAANRDEEGRLYINSSSFPCSMSFAGVNHIFSGRKTYKTIVANAVRTTSDKIFLLDPVTNTPYMDFEIDSRAVTIPSTRGRIIRHRPRFDRWACEFDLAINEDLIAVEMVHELLNEAGTIIGVGDYRPQKSGPFGCFRVVRFGDFLEEEVASDDETFDRSMQWLAAQ